MRKLVVIGLALLTTTAVWAKADFAKATGYKCADCHIAGKFKEPNPDNKLWAVAKHYSEAIAKKEGPAAGKQCNDCHQGQHTPAKK